MTNSAFHLLHPFLQQMLYKMRWTELRPIQVDTIHTIFNTQKNVIISAHTAGGKTEAAFLPVLSKIIEQKSGGVKAIYIGPLKALINDQFRRLEKLCELSDIPVFKWHGDISASDKKTYLKNPAGVLLITPESIESIFINHSNEVPRLFHNVSFIVIDEMHSFIGTERGAHVKSLINRISIHSDTKIRIVGLSATLGNLEIAKGWLLPKEPESIEIIQDLSERKEIQFLIKGYIAEESTNGSEINSHLEALIKDVIHYFYGKTALVFINSKPLLEYYTDYFHRYMESIKLSDYFRIHHGSLSKMEREETEYLLKSGTPTVAFCSSTLELGIDIGDVSIVGQIGSPWSVSSLLQRLGRSGRAENTPSIMILFIEEILKDSSIIDRIYPHLTQSIAMTELMLERWCEPPINNFAHYSTFIQQILSVITERGGILISELFDHLVLQGTFNSILKTEFVEILKQLKKEDLIDQDSKGLLLLGLKGEKIVRSLEFYSAFISKRELSVLHKGKKIGSVAAFPGVETQHFLILAGRRWNIIQCDFTRKEIIVEPSKGGKLPAFYATSGPDIHQRVREKMRDVLFSDKIPQYLDTQAAEMLKSAQLTTIQSGLRDSPFIQDGNDTYWFTWTGSAKHRTLFALGRYFADLKVEDCQLAIKFTGISPDQIKTIYKKILNSPPSAYEIAEKFSNREFEKYDEYLPDKILIKSYAQKQIDTDFTDILLSL